MRRLIKTLMSAFARGFGRSLRGACRGAGRFLFFLSAANHSFMASNARLYFSVSSVSRGTTCFSNQIATSYDSFDLFVKHCKALRMTRSNTIGSPRTLGILGKLKSLGKASSNSECICLVDTDLAKCKLPSLITIARILAENTLTRPSRSMPRVALLALLGGGRVKNKSKVDSNPERCLCELHLWLILDSSASHDSSM